MNPRARRPRGRAARTAVASGVALGVLGPALALAPAGAAETPAPAAPAAAITSFQGKAAADGVYIRIAVVDFLIIDNFLEGPGPTAQASVDSLGESIGFASYPNPGQTVQALPGLVSTLTGKSLPTYPFTASTQFPSSQKREIKQPGFTLTSTSLERSSSAYAGLGTQSGDLEGGSFSKADVGLNDSGAFEAAASSRTALKIGPLELSGISSSAKVVRTGDGKVAKSSSLDVATLTLSGLPITVTEGGLAIGNSQVPLPLLGSITQAVTMGDSSLTFLKGTETANSVVSPALEFTTTMPVPQLGAAKAVVTFTLGRTSATADAAAFVPGAPPTTPTTPTDPGTPSTPGTPAVPGTPAIPGTSGTPPLPGTTDPGALPTEGGQPPVLAPEPGFPGDPVAPVAALDTSGLTRLNFYPILLLAAGLLVSASVGSRRFMKARMQWSS